MEAVVRGSGGGRWAVGQRGFFASRRCCMWRSRRLGRCRNPGWREDLGRRRGMIEEKGGGGGAAEAPLVRRRRPSSDVDGG